MFKQKQNHKSKEQLIWEKEEKRVGEIRKRFIDEHFMPLMEGLTENIEEAQMICESLKTAINQAWQVKAGEMLLRELKLGDSLRKVKKPELVSKHLKVLELLENSQTIRDSMILLDALFAEADRAVKASVTTKKLSDFHDDSTKPTDNKPRQ
jgi:hypothetical protein